VALAWVPPFAAHRSQNRAVEQAAEGDLEAAADSARRAASWDPLAADPLVTLALIEQQQGQNRAALESLDSAARLQPENYVVHYQRGLLLERVFDRRKDAAAAFRRALELNPLHESSRSELERLVAGG
jgi:tetratricopeptide (TPR) repeat protein